MMLRQEHIIYAVDGFVFQLNIISCISSLVMMKPHGLDYVMNKVGSCAYKNIDFPVPYHIAYNMPHPAGTIAPARPKNFVQSGSFIISRYMSTASSMRPAPTAQPEKEFTSSSTDIF